MAAADAVLAPARDHPRPWELLQGLSAHGASTPSILWCTALIDSWVRRRWRWLPSADRDACKAALALLSSKLPSLRRPPARRPTRSVRSAASSKACSQLVRQDCRRGGRTCCCRSSAHRCDGPPCMLNLIGEEASAMAAPPRGSGACRSREPVPAGARAVPAGARGRGGCGSGRRWPSAASRRRAHQTWPRRAQPLRSLRRRRRCSTPSARESRRCSRRGRAVRRRCSCSACWRRSRCPAPSLPPPPSSTSSPLRSISSSGDADRATAYDRLDPGMERGAADEAASTIGLVWRKGASRPPPPRRRPRRPCPCLISALADGSRTRGAGAHQGDDRDREPPVPSGSQAGRSRVRDVDIASSPDSAAFTASLEAPSPTRAPPRCSVPAHATPAVCARVGGRRRRRPADWWDAGSPRR